MLREYHSLPKAGTEYGPQCAYIPNLASSNQLGIGCVATLHHFAV